MNRRRLAVLVAPRLFSESLRELLTGRYLLVEPDANPDLIIVTCRELAQVQSRGRKLLLTCGEPIPPLSQLISEDVRGVLACENLDKSALSDAIELIEAGSTVIPWKALEGFLACMRSDPVVLTGRQREVADCIASRLSNKEIAKRLRISVSTVKNHVCAVLTAYGSNSRYVLAEELRKYHSSPTH